MIKHHPTSNVLSGFVAGDLPASVAIIVASHVELCRECANHVQQLTEQAAMQAFDMTADDDWLNHQVQLGDTSPQHINDIDHDGIESNDMELACDSRAMIDAITASPAQVKSAVAQTVTEIEVAGQRISLPRAMKSIGLREWQGLGKLSRARLALDDDELRASLLHIDKGGSVPCHTHKGFEITLLLQGSFDDEMGHYTAGDFIWLDGDHTHQPITQEGCVCLTVSSDAIHFTQGMSQLLNPIGRFIY
ncbi:ChrR family anti-sigma-E factor [Shewanella algidipiscicola]|uniref:ChrR family anti-sigma-E factor n=1 Tax=Shewanella algidipiscicola TaxID=614070 RepID=UPI000D785808|nr:ChrR family anti-sigma-E factor [Shewanella algidipiscicola]